MSGTTPLRREPRHPDAQGATPVPCFETLYRRYRVHVERAVGAILRDPRDAEEATHDVLLKGHEALKAGRVVAGALPRWLRTTARHHALDVLKSRQRARALDGRYALAHESEPAPGPETGLEARTVTDLLRRSHPQELRLVERCLVLEGDRAHIAHELGVTRGNLSVRLHRAVARLRSALDEHSS